MKKLFVILFSLILFISCDSMSGSFETSVQKISEKEILDIQNSKKDTVQISINNVDGIIYIIDNNEVVAKTILDNQNDYVILHDMGLIGLILAIFLSFFFGVYVMSSQN